MRFPTIPLLVVAGLAVVVGLIAYLIWQTGQEGGSGFGEAAEVEADPAPDLPGEYVNLPEIYEGFYRNEDGPNTADHVTEDVDYTDQGLPPAGGPHWGRGECPVDDNGNPNPTSFCGPAPWGIYREPWPAEVLVHNMEHGGIDVWYNTTDQSVIDDLEDLVQDRLDDGMLIVMAPFPDMEEEHIAVTGWARRDLIPVEEYDRDRVADFIDTHERRFNPEDF